MLDICAEPQGLVIFFFCLSSPVGDRQTRVLRELPHKLVWCEPHIPRRKRPQHQVDAVLLTGANQTNRESDLAQTSALFCHTLALGSGEFGSGSSPRGNRMAEKHFWKLKAKTWQWKSCCSCLTCGLWMAQCPVKPFSCQLKIAQASLLIVSIATIFKASATVQFEGLIQR